MATQLPPNLDDDELWLPSDIIPEVGSFRPVSSGPGYIEAQDKQLAAIGFLDPYLGPKRHVPAVKPPLDLVKVFLPLTGFGFGYDDYHAPAGTSAYLQGFSAIQHQVADCFGPGRLWRRRQQNAGMARYYPSHANGSGRPFAGTGVFLPRVVNNEAAKIKPASGMKGTGEEKQQQQAAAAGKRVGGNQMQVMALIHPPPKTSLPQEWTY